MGTKKKIITFIIGVETVIIAIVIIFLFYINSDTVKVNRQLELAQRYLLEEDYEQAIAAFEIVIEIDPKNVEAYLGLAEAYVAADELENAVKILEKAAKRVDSEEVLAQLEIHTAEMEQREQTVQRASQAAQRAAEAARIAAEAVASSEKTATTSQQESTATELPEPGSEIVLTGFIVRDGELYYYDETGNCVTGWFDKNNNRYCARDDGRLYKSGEYEIDSAKYLFDHGGVCLGEMEEETWKQAYIDYIQQLHRTYCVQDIYYDDLYGLIYVDDNDIPELAIYLILKAQCNSISIASYANGVVSSCHGTYLSYIERGNLVYVNKGEGGPSPVQIIRFKEGEQLVIAEGCDSENMYDYYEWNGIQVSQKEYKRELNKVYDENRARGVEIDTPYSYEEILDIISNY